MRTLGFQVGDDDLQITEAAGQPINARDHQRFSWMDEVEDRFQFRPPLQARATLLLGADHAASGRFQGSNLRIKVLFDG